MKRIPPQGGWFIDLAGGYKGRGRNKRRSHLPVISHVRKMVVVVFVVAVVAAVVVVVVVVGTFRSVGLASFFGFEGFSTTGSTRPVPTRPD